MLHYEKSQSNNGYKKSNSSKSFKSNISYKEKDILPVLDLQFGFTYLEL